MGEVESAEALFAKYIEERKVVIADSSAGVRSGIAKILKDLGAKTANLILCHDFEEAAEEVVRVRPPVIICDYLLEGRQGLELLRLQRIHLPDPRECLFVLVTSNSSESSVAEAAEEEVDGFILKPFTLAIFRDQMLASATRKFRPSGYQERIRAGKESLKGGDAAKALEAFEEARKLSPKPALAHFYIGLINKNEASQGPAEGNFRTGLEIQERHFKCLGGLCDVLFESKRYEEAYRAAKTLVSTFPLSPQRLDTILRLAVKNQVFDDIEELYEIYRNMDFRTPELVRCMRAALLVAGHYQLKRYRIDKAMEQFRKAFAVSPRDPELYAEVVSALLKHDYAEEAESCLRGYPQELQSTAAFHALQLRALDARGPISKVIERARQLVAAGHNEPAIYEVLIRRSHEAGYLDSAESFAQEAARRWPNLQEEFRKLLLKI